MKSKAMEKTKQLTSKKIKMYSRAKKSVPGSLPLFSPNPGTCQNDSTYPVLSL